LDVLQTMGIPNVQTSAWIPPTVPQKSSLLTDTAAGIAEPQVYNIGSGRSYGGAPVRTNISAACGRYLSSGVLGRGHGEFSNPQSASMATTRLTEDF
jgi:hypothetical protein